MKIQINNYQELEEFMDSHSLRQCNKCGWTVHKIVKLNKEKIYCCLKCEDK